MKAPSILFRCDGSVEIGLGHVVRCLALADELHEFHRCQIIFAMRNGPLGYDMVQKKGYKLFDSLENGDPFDYALWLNSIVDKIKPQAMVLDMRDDLPVELVRSYRDAGILIVTLDDPSERRLVADLAFYPPVPQVLRMNWIGFTGKLFVGWEWILLRREFSQPVSRPQNQISVVLVTMGGSDPAGMTLKAIKALDLLDEDFETIVVLGSGFSQLEALTNLLAITHRRFDVRKNVVDMKSLMVQAELAVASFGTTAYELASLGTPAILLCLTEDHAYSAEGLVKEEMAISLGLFDQVNETTLARHIRKALNDTGLRHRMGETAKKKINGNGTERTAHKIIECLSGGE